MQTDATPIHLDQARFREHCLTLTESQRKFARLVHAWAKNPCKLIAVVSGGPGTGKSHVVKKTLDLVEKEQLKMSYTARSAQAIGGRTIHSALQLNYRGRLLELEKQLENEEDLVAAIKASSDVLTLFKFFDDPWIVVVDEVSMINAWLMYWLIRFLMDRTARPLLVVLIGDQYQLSPVKFHYNVFSFHFSESRYIVRRIHLLENKRFTPEYGALIEAMCRFVDARDESGFFAFLCEHFPVCESIDASHLAQANRAMAAKNDRVDSFNAYYIKNLVAGPEVRIHEKLILKPGCSVIVTQNGYSPVLNGTELTFRRFCESRERVICEHPKTHEEVAVRKHPESDTFPLAVGFAITIHKFQGETIDSAKIVIHFGGNRSLNLAYTALSRVRHKGQIVAIAL